MKANKNNYYLQFCKNIFGVGYYDQVHTDKGIELYFEGTTKFKDVDDVFIIESINLNSKIKVIKMDGTSKDIDNIMYRDGYLFKIIFSNGLLYEKNIRQVIDKCALISEAK